jgi:hypothetical protein
MRLFGQIVAALADLLTKLATLGLIVDGSSA